MSVSIISDSEDARKWELTQRKMEDVRKSILGDEGVDSSGRRTKFGYMGDIGHLPAHLDSLVSSHTPAWSYNNTYGIGAGWRGPYYHSGFDDPYVVSSDAWGNPFVYSTTADPPSLISYGADGSSGGIIYNQDITVNFDAGVRFSKIRGTVRSGSAVLSGRTVQIRYPVDGALTTTTDSTDANGNFVFNSVPYGIHSIEITDDPTLGPFPVVVDTPEYMVPTDFFNYRSYAAFITPDYNSLTCLDTTGNNHGINLINHYPDTQVSASKMAYYWDDVGADLDKVSLNGTEQTISGGAEAGEEFDISKSLTIPAGGTVPLNLYFNNKVQLRAITGLLQWNEVADRDSVSWQTLKCDLTIDIFRIQSYSECSSGTEIETEYEIPTGVGSNLLLVMGIVAEKDGSSDVEMDKCYWNNVEGNKYISNKDGSGNFYVSSSQCVWDVSSQAGESHTARATWPSGKNVDSRALFLATIVFVDTAVGAENIDSVTSTSGTATLDFDVKSNNSMLVSLVSLEDNPSKSLEAKPNDADHPIDENILPGGSCKARYALGHYFAETLGYHNGFGYKQINSPIMVLTVAQFKGQYQ